MANLIITVISIALVAVAALMGAYYGGTAFMDGQVKAKANTIISQMEQISAAATLQASATGIPLLTGTDFTSLVSTGYLSAVPTPPKLDPLTSNYLCIMSMVGFTDFDPCSPANLSSEMAFVALVLDNGSADANNPSNVCKAVAKMAGGAAEVPDSSDNGVITRPGYRFDCVFGSASGNWYIIYKL